MTTSHTDVAQIVRDHLARELQIDRADVSDDAVLKNLSGADSVRLLRVMSRIERHWDIEFADEDVFGVKTLGELVDLIVVHIGRRE